VQHIQREGERSESLLSILYLTVLLGARNFQSSKERVFYCKGNLAVSRQSLRLARENPKRIYKRNIIHENNMPLT